MSFTCCWQDVISLKLTKSKMEIRKTNIEKCWGQMSSCLANNCLSPLKKKQNNTKQNKTKKQLHLIMFVAGWLMFDIKWIISWSHLGSFGIFLLIPTNVGGKCSFLIHDQCVHIHQKHERKSLWYFLNRLPYSTSCKCLADKHTQANATGWLGLPPFSPLLHFVLPVKQTEALGRWHLWLRSPVWNVSWGLLLQLSAARPAHTIHEQFSLLLLQTKRRLIPPLTPSLSSLLYSSSVMRREDSRGAEHQWRADSKLPRCICGSQTGVRKPSRRLDLALVVQSLSCRRGGKGVDERPLSHPTANYSPN